MSNYIPRPPRTQPLNPGFGQAIDFDRWGEVSDTSSIVDAPSSIGERFDWDGDPFDDEIETNYIPRRPQRFRIPMWQPPKYILKKINPKYNVWKSKFPFFNFTNYKHWHDHLDRRFKNLPKDYYADYDEFRQAWRKGRTASTKRSIRYNRNIGSRFLNGKTYFRETKSAIPLPVLH